MANYRSLIGFEYKKLLKRKIVWIMVVVMMILCILTACINCLGNFYVEGELFETHYEKIQKEHNFARNLSGRTIDDELLQEMWDSYAKVEETEVNQWLTESYQQYGRPYNSVLFFLMEMTGKDNVENMSAAQAYALRKQQQEQEWKKYYLTDGEKDYLAEMDSEGATPLVFAYGDGYECICAMLQVVGIFMTLLVAACVPVIFTEEYTRKTDQLILCSQYGKKMLFGAKAFVAVSFTIATSVLLILSLVIPAFIVYGTDGFDSQIQLSLPTVPWHLTRGEMLVILIGLCLIVSVFQCLISVWMAEKTKNHVTVMVILVGVMLVCMMFNIPNAYRVLSQIYSYLPFRAISVGNVFGPRLVPVFCSYWAAWQIIPVIYGVAAVALWLLGKWQYEHYEISSR